MQRTGRLKKEMQMMETSPPFGISCWMKEEKLEELEAQIIGSEGTPYDGGLFKLEVSIPDRYPFEPPKVRFVTPIYHPNIDNAGRICLDSLKMPPKGAWKPSLNISTILTTIQLLMSEPNPDDPLMAEIANEFRHNRPAFEQTAREWTGRHARPAVRPQGGTVGKAEEEEEKEKENRGAKLAPAPDHVAKKREASEAPQQQPLAQSKVARN